MATKTLTNMRNDAKALDTTGLNRLGVNDQALEDKGLFRPAKNVWTAGVAIG